MYESVSGRFFERFSVKIYIYIYIFIYIYIYIYPVAQNCHYTEGQSDKIYCILT